ncbi:hypothetical protein F5Y19DRAFT_469876 [Xylariaceae sp. FL1651]|nr:hypothetical protein F5Y19DRAFT_469876 [Xylariaceae sp. FL1651]
MAASPVVSMQASSSDQNEPDSTFESPSQSKWDQALERLRKEDQEQFDLARKSFNNPHNVLSSVLEAANKRKEECLKKRWKLVVNGRTIIMRDVLEKLSVWVKKLVAIGDIAIQYNPVSAALPWAALRLILQASINDMEVFGSILISLERVANFMTLSGIIETQYFGTKTKQSRELSNLLSNSMINLYTAILQHLAEILHYYKSTTLTRIAKSISTSQVDIEAKLLPVTRARDDLWHLISLAETEKRDVGFAKVESIERQIQDVDERGHAKIQSMANALQQPIDRIDARLAEIHDGLQRDIRLKILRAISPMPYGVHHKAACKGRLEGSGRWLLRKPAYGEWIGVSSSSVLWLHGIPGSGKTKLASLVIDELKEHEHLAYCYCMKNPAEPHRAQGNRILASIVRQFASVALNTPILPPVVSYYESAIDGLVDFDDLALTVEDSVDLLLQLFEEYPAVVLVIDALDEVNQEDRQEILDALSSLLTKSACLVRVFISSRSNYDIALHLSGSPNIYIKASDNTEDISAFIDKQLTSARLLHGQLMPSLRDEIIKVLTSGANGMFRWVDLQIQSLRPLKVAADVTARLGKLPNTLEGSYWEIFQQIEDSGENAFRLATLTFQWLLYAQDSMPIDGFAVLASTALASKHSGVITSEQILDVCSNLIVIRLNSFGFVHLSVREFFEQIHKRGIETYLPERSHVAIGGACLQYLHTASISAKQEESYDKRLAEIDVVETLRYRVLTKYPWVLRPYSKELSAITAHNFKADVPSGYAATYGIYHVQEAGALRMEQPLSGIIQTFMLEKSETPSGSICTVARGFVTWCAIIYALRHRHSRYRPSSRKYLPIFITIFPPSPVWLACAFEWYELVEYLYQFQYAGINELRFVKELAHPQPVTPYWYAVLTKRTDLADCLVRAKADTIRKISVKEDIVELMTIAAKSGDFAFIRFLSRQDFSGQEVADQAFIEAVRAVLQTIGNGDSDPYRDLDNRALLMKREAKMAVAAIVMAARAHTRQTSSRLLAAVYDMNRKFLKKRRIALHFAAVSGQDKVMNALLDHSAEVNALDNDGKTPLHLAAAHLS